MVLSLIEEAQEPGAEVEEYADTIEWKYRGITDLERLPEGQLKELFQ
jgi:hypothetical protein